MQHVLHYQGLNSCDSLEAAGLLTQLENIKGRVSSGTEHKDYWGHVGGLAVDGGVVQRWGLHILVTHLGNDIASDANCDTVHA